MLTSVLVWVDFSLGKLGPYSSNDSHSVPECVESCLKSSSLCTCSGYTAQFELQSEIRIIHARCSNSTKRDYIMCPSLSKFMNTPHNVILKRNHQIYNCSL